MQSYGDVPRAGTNPPALRLIHMRFLYSLVLSGFLILAGACSPSRRAVPPVEPGQTSTATANDSSLSNFIPPSGPAATGKRLLEGDGQMHFLDSPIPYTVQQMSYGDAHQYIPMLSTDYPPDSPLTPQTPVYLVAFRGRWESTPGGPPGAAPVEYQGCIFVLFTVNDSKLIAAGDTTCPGKG